MPGLLDQSNVAMAERRVDEPSAIEVEVAQLAMLPVTPTTFHPFPALPTEIRMRVLGLALDDTKRRLFFHPCAGILSAVEGLEGVRLG